MANPLIALQSQVPDIGQAFSNALMNIQAINNIRQSRAEAPLRRQQFEMQNQALALGNQQTRNTMDRAQQEALLKDQVIMAAQINAAPDNLSKMRTADALRQRLIDSGAPPEAMQGLEEVLDMGRRGDFAGMQEMLSGVINMGQQMGFLESPSATQSEVKVQSSELLPGGGARLVMSDGSTRLVKPGEDVMQFIQQAEERGANLQGLRAGERAAATEGQKQATKFFEQIGRVKTSISNIDEAIQALDDGAETGFIRSKLPSVQSASQRLDNIQARMGLDVIGNTTFGALSESELKFALSAALPQNLEPAKLRQWLVDKKNAQLKLANYLNDAATYLGEPGNTVSGWLKAQKDLNQTGDQNQTATVSGGQANQPIIMQFDSQGNLIQ